MSRRLSDPQTRKRGSARLRLRPPSPRAAESANPNEKPGDLDGQGRSIDARENTKKLHPWSWVPKVLTFLGLVGTTVAALAAAVYIVAPDLKPRDKLGATVDHVAVEHGVDNIDYRLRMNMDDEPGEKPRMGDMIFVRVSLTGFKDRSYSIGIQLLGDKDQRIEPADPETYGRQAVSTCEDLSPKADEDGITWRCWAATPAPGVKYRFRVELYDYGLTENLKTGPLTDTPVMLDFHETEIFTSIS